MAHDLKSFEPSKAGAYDPGKLIILFDGRHSGPPPGSDTTSTLTSFWISSMYRVGWSGLQSADVEPRKLRLVWYTHAGNEGSRDFPLWKAYTVKEMFDSLSEGGYRPMILGWSGTTPRSALNALVRSKPMAVDSAHSLTSNTVAENPFPMIGGSEPPPEPKKEQPRVSSTWSDTASGHSEKKGTTPHDRVMAIIEQDERREAERRKQEVEKASKEKASLGGQTAV